MYTVLIGIVLSWVLKKVRFSAECRGGWHWSPLHEACHLLLCHGSGQENLTWHNRHFLTSCTGIKWRLVDSLPKGILIGLDKFCWLSYHYILNCWNSIRPSKKFSGREGGRERIRGKEVRKGVREEIIPEGQKGEREERKLKQILILKMILWGTDLLRRVLIVYIFYFSNMDCNHREEWN